MMVDGPLSLPKWRISQCFHHKRLLSRDYITCLLKQFGLKPGMQIFISKRDSFAHNFKRRREEWRKKNKSMSIQSRKGSTPYVYCLNKHTFTEWNILNHVICFPKSSFLWNTARTSVIPALSGLHHCLAKVSTHTDEVIDVQMHCSCCHRGSRPVCFPNNPFYLCACLRASAQILFTWMTIPGWNKIRSKEKWKWIKEAIHLTFFK